MSDEQLDTTGAVADFLGGSLPDRARASIAGAVNSKPDFEARIRKMSTEAGVPISTARELPDEVNRKAKMESMDFDDLSKKFPSTMQFLTQQDNAKIAHDDVNNMGLIEASVNSFKRGIPGLKQNLSATSLRANANILGNVDAIEKKMAAGENVLDSEDPFALRFMTPEQRSDFRAQAIRAAGGNATSIAENQAIKDAIPQPGVVNQVMSAKGWGEAINAFMSDPVTFVASIGPESLVQNAPGMVAGAVIPGGVAVKAATMGVGSGVTDYGSSLLEGLSKAGVDIKDTEALKKAAQNPKLMQQVAAQAMAHAMVVGTVDGASGGIAGKLAIPTKVIKGPVAREAANIVTQMPIQGAMGAAGEAGGELAAGQQLDPGNILAEFVGESFTAPAEVASMVSGQVRERVAQAREAEAHAKSLEELSKFSEASKVKARDADTFKAFVEQAAQNGETPTELFIDPTLLANSLNQSGMTVQEMQALVPVAMGQIQEAMANGVDVRVPVGEFAAVGEKVTAPLIDHFRTSEDAMTRAEATLYLDEKGAEIKAQVEKALSEHEESSAHQQSINNVQANFEAQLNTANRFTSAANKAYASLLANFYGAQAQRLGITPEELAQKYGLKVQAQSVAGERTLNQGSLGAELSSRIAGDFDGAVREYDAIPGTDGGRILNTDEARELSEGYRADRTKSADVHEASSQFVKDLYASKLAQPTPVGRQPLVLFTAGGTGAGKSTSLQTDQGKAMYEAAEMVYDTNMNSLDSAVKKIDQALDAGRSVAILYTFRDPVDALVKGALPRAMRMGRTVPLAEHAKTHAGAYKTVAALREKYADDPRVAVQVVDNSRGAGNAQVTEFDALPGIADTDLEETLYANLQQELQAGRISQQVFAGTAGLRREGVEQAGGGTGSSEPSRADQKQLNQGETAPRAQIAFADDIAGSPSVISLLAGADLSSFIHESGHFFLEVQTDLATKIQQQASEGGSLSPGEQAVVDDMNTLLSWFGVKGSENQTPLEAWGAMSLDEKRQYHEQFARGFEAYTMEGKAPSLALQEVFGRFRSWLIHVYTTLRNLNVTLTDDVRQVMGRMLATDFAIEEAEAARNMGPLFVDAKSAGMTMEQFDAYQATARAATDKAAAELQVRGMRDMQWVSRAKDKAIKARQTEVEGLRREVRREVTSEVLSQAVYRAWQFLAGKGEAVDVVEPGSLPIGEIDTITQKGKLRTSAVKELSREQWEVLSKRRMTSEDNGMHPEIVAELFGFDSGDALVQALLEAKPPREQIADLTDIRMMEKYGDIASQEALNRAADEAVHNEARARFIASELKALQDANTVREKRGKKGSIDVMAQAAKQYAADIINRLKVRDLRPAQYASAEVRSSRLAEQALKKGELPEAAMHKRNQLVNNYATKAAYNAQDEIKATIKYFKRFDKRSKSIDPAYMDQIEALLERFDLRNTSLRAVDKRKSLVEWVESQREQGLEPDIPPELLNEAIRQSYKDMTVDELRGLRDTVQQIEHLGRLKNQLLTAKANKDFEAVRSELVKSIDEHAGYRQADTRTPTTVLGEKLLALKKFWASHIKAATWARILDGGKDGGPVWEYLIRTANEAGDNETVAREKATKDLSALVAPVLKEGKLGGKGEFFPSVNRSINREGKLAIALNLGNESNMQRLLGGEGWTLQQLQPVLDTLTAEDWKFVQGVWDYFESFRPQIAAKERRVYGVEPDWIKPTPVVTKFGTLKGGYYPVKYDPRASERAESHADAEEAKRQMQGAYTSSTTRRSFTKSRAEEVKGRPLLYSLDGIYGGIQEVIHDLSWHEWLIDANKILRNQTISTAIREHYGPEVHQQFKTWTEDIAGGEQATRAAGEKALAWVRQGVSISGLGLNVMSAMMQPLGITQSMVRIGPKWVGRGIAKAMGSPAETYREINSKSDFMRTRALTRMRELNELRNQVKGQTETRAKIDAAAYALMLRAQQLVDIPTWWGAYEKAIAEGNNDARATDLADQAVIDAQGSGGTKDQAAIERGGPALKLFTVFYSFMNTALNLGAQSTMTEASRAKLAANYLMLYVIPPILGFMLKNALTPGDSGDDDDWGKFANKVVKEELGFLLGLFFGLRELQGAWDAFQGKPGGDYSGPAGGRLIGDTLKLTKQVGQGEADDGLRKAIINVAGELFRLPSAQINRTITGAEALGEGKTQNPSALLFGFQEKR